MRCGSPTLGRFDSGAAPSSQIQRSDGPLGGSSLGLSAWRRAARSPFTVTACGGFLLSDADFRGAARAGVGQASTRITSVSGTTPSCAIASVAASVSIAAMTASISGTSISKPTLVAFCGSKRLVPS